MNPLPCPNPHCYTPIAHSVLALTHLISTRPTSFNKLIPSSCYNNIYHPSLCTRALYMHHASPYRYIPNLKTDVQQSNSSYSNTAIPPFFKPYTGNSSNPGALPDFISFTASLTSSYDIAHSFKSPNTGIC